MHDAEPHEFNPLPERAASTRSVPSWSPERLEGLGLTTDLMTAADLLGIKRTKAYTLARTGRFPVPTVRIGRNYRVAVASIVELFGLDKAPRA